MAETQGTISSQFLVRFSSLPMVHTALDYATNTYGRVKEVNPVVTFAFNTAEKSAMYANEKAKPIVKRFEKQISIADGLACKGLEVLEEKVPLITKPTEMIVQDTRSLYSNTIQTGVNSFNNVKTFGINKVNAVKNCGLERATGFIHSPYGKVVADSVNGALSLTEIYVEHILPPLDASDKDDDKKTEVLDRVAKLTSRIQRRLYSHALNKAQNVKQATTQSFLRYTHSDLVANAYVNATWVWEELNKEPEATENVDDKSLNHHLWSSARFATKQLVSVFTTAKTTILVIPDRLNSGVSTVYNLSSTLPSRFQSSLIIVYGLTTNAASYVQSVNPQEVATALVQMKDRFHVEERLHFLVQTILHSTAIQWLVHHVSKETSEQSTPSEPAEQHE